MKSKLNASATAALLGLAVLAAGCSTTRTFVDYSRGALYSTETAGNVPYVEIGPVSAIKRGYVWDKCSQLAENAVDQLRVAAEERGANNVIAVRWLNHADGSYTETPICTTGWGWFAAFVVPGFAPWVQTTEVRGRLVHAEESNLSGLRQEVQRRMADYQRRKGEFSAQSPVAATPAEPPATAPAAEPPSTTPSPAP